MRDQFSLQKITWNPTSKIVIYRSKRHHTTKRNFEIFKAPYFIASAFLHFQGRFASGGVYRVGGGGLVSAASGTAGLAPSSRAQ